MTTLIHDAVGGVDAERSLAVFPGGSNGEFGLPAGLTRVIERGQGCRLLDTAGNELLDMSMGWGSALVGHARAEVVDAVVGAAPLGGNFAYPSAHALGLAEELVRLSPACDRVRFCASGTEATMYCLRLARAFSGRAVTLRFEGAYHGSHDVGVTSLFPSGETAFPEPEPSSAGIHAQHTIVAPFNDSATATRIIAEHASELGAVIVEPLQRCLPPRAGFLESLRESCTRHGVPLIFDEVVTGFRLAYGGAQEKYGVIPDLVAYGKALGGGLPIGAFGGGAEIMDLVEERRIGEDGYVWTASTLGGNPISTAAASAALGVFCGAGVYERLYELGERLREGMRRVLRDAGEVATVIGDGPLAQVVFAEHEVTDYRTTIASDRARGRALMLELWRRGVFLNPMGTKLYLSLAHTEAECSAFCEHMAASLRAL